MRSRWMTRRAPETAALLVLAFALACGEAAPPEQARLDRGFAWAVAELARVNTEPLAAASLREIRDQGGTLTTYVTAGTAPDADLPPFATGQPMVPWSVVLRELDGGRVVVEGYGASLDRPVRADTVVIR